LANFAFIGGQLEPGQSLAECLKAEYRQELGLNIAEPKYLFVVENRFWFGGAVFHGLEHYFLVDAPEGEVMSREAHLRFTWLPVKQLADFDLRPVVVRDAILDDRWQYVHILTMPFQSRI
jgi:8-oxo-dGTP pyrophosphatase MutT (NUDIX family)